MNRSEKAEDVALLSFSRFATFADLRNVSEELRQFKEDQAKMKQQLDQIKFLPLYNWGVHYFKRMRELNKGVPAERLINPRRKARTG